MHLLEAAFAYLKAGYAVIPLWRDVRKNPHLSTFSEYHFRLPTQSEWVRWARQWPCANIGLITGYWGLVGLDFDNETSYRTWCLGAGIGIAGRTWTVATRRGYHVWFKVSNDPGQSRNYTQDGHTVLLRAKGGYCIVPPSIHHTGTRYRTIHKIEPFKVDSIELYLSDWQEAEHNTPARRPNIPLELTTIAKIEDFIAPIGKPNYRGAYQAFCPFHDDKRPSAWVNPTEGRFGCNACWPGKWFDIINVYAMLNGLTNSQAWGQIMASSGSKERVSPQSRKHGL